MMICWTRRSYTKEEFILAWNTSLSIAECGRKLGLNVSGTTYTTLKRTAEALALGAEHMTGAGWRKGKVFPSSKRPLSSILVEDSSYSTSHLKSRLIAEDILPRRCSMCLGVEWNKLPIPLELDHINGVNRDHRLNNLRLLCPNCHAQTATYRGKNIKSRPLSYAKRNPSRCKDCTTEIESRSIRCRSCYSAFRASNKTTKQTNKRKTKIVWPSVAHVVSLVNRSGYSAVGASLGVSDNAVRKFLKSHGVVMTSIPLVV